MRRARSLRVPCSILREYANLVRGYSLRRSSYLLVFSEDLYCDAYWLGRTVFCLCLVFVMGWTMCVVLYFENIASRHDWMLSELA